MRQEAGKVWSKRGHGPNVDLHCQLASQTEPRFADLQQARRSAPQDTEAAADLQAQFSHPANKAWLPSDICDVCPLARVQHFQRDYVGTHGRSLIVIET